MKLFIDPVLVNSEASTYFDKLVEQDIDNFGESIRDIGNNVLPIFTKDPIVLCKMRLIYKLTNNLEEYWLIIPHSICVRQNNNPYKS